MPDIKIDQPILAIDKTKIRVPSMTGNGEDLIDLTLRDVLYRSCVLQPSYIDDNKIRRTVTSPQDVLYRKFKMAARIEAVKKNGTLNMSSEEAVELKNWVYELWQRNDRAIEIIGTVQSIIE